jgi:apolipoprotein N-acyltransferase
VCFDSIYDSLARKSVREGASLLTISTNDSWFTDSAALYMHNAQAQMRAVENGRYVVRAANTGISTAISAKGEVLDSLPPLVEGMVVCDVGVNTHTTLYSLTGNVMLVLFAIALACVFADDVARRFYKKNKQKS